MGYSNEDFYEQIHKKLKVKTVVPTIDAHLHFTDFLQTGEGVDRLLEEMEEGNIQKTVLFGMPVMKKWAYYRKKKPSYYLSDNAKCYYYSRTDDILANQLLKLSKSKQEKIAPLICGFNPTDMNAVEHVKSLLEEYPFWKGVGEILFRHDDLTNLTIGEIARPNHPAMFPIYELCAERKLPILLHQNATNEWEVDDEDDEHTYADELTYVLDKFPETTIIWAHCGVSRRTNLKHYTGFLDDLLEKYPQLHMDISWVVFDNMIMRDGEPRTRWIDLIEKHKTRFFLGSDLLGHYDDLGRSMGRYNPLLKALDKKTAKLLAYDNANKMWFGSKD